jgi:hypothetical protein
VLGTIQGHARADPDAMLDAAERRLLVEALEGMGGGRGGPGRG